MIQPECTRVHLVEAVCVGICYNRVQGQSYSHPGNGVKLGTWQYLMTISVFPFLNNQNITNFDRILHSVYLLGSLTFDLNIVFRV